MNFLPPATKLRQGNVFTPVCHSVLGWGISVPACIIGQMTRGVSVQGGICPGGSLSRGISVREGLCPGGLCPGGSLSREVSVQEGLCPERPPGQRSLPRLVTCGWYASYWNAFLFVNILSEFIVECIFYHFPDIKIASHKMEISNL